MDEKFVPALGKHWLTGVYDYAIALMTRERKWRGALIDLIRPVDADVIVDVGSGTGTLAIALKRRARKARIVAVDPDPTVIDIAKRKAARAGVAIEWVRAMGDQTAERVGSAVADKVVSSLVFHQCPPDAKLTILTAMRRTAKPGGRLFIADYGLQRTFLMKLLFRQVQSLDGWENTTPNARGELPSFIARAGFEAVEEVQVIPTLTGSISLYRAAVPQSPPAR